MVQAMGKKREERACDDRVPGDRAEELPDYRA